jgi:GNAT superfamily N-acetyltransferase
LLKDLYSKTPPEEASASFDILFGTKQSKNIKFDKLEIGNTIREATIADLEDLAQLFEEYRLFYQQPADLSGARAFLSERINQGDSRIFVSVKDEKLSGFTQLYPLFSSTRMKRLWLLNDLYVKNEFRGLGISKGLINRAKQLCEDTQACGFILETAKTNLIANCLYHAVGMTLDHDHNYYSWDVGS